MSGNVDKKKVAEEALARGVESGEVPKDIADAALAGMGNQQVQQQKGEHREMTLQEFMALPRAHQIAMTIGEMIKGDAGITAIEGVLAVLAQLMAANGRADAVMHFDGASIKVKLEQHDQAEV